MPLDAQSELQNLLDLQSSGQTAAANSKKLREANTAEFSAGDNAQFALPEALATAIGGAWLLGPVGGVLLGVAQGILGKREKQTAIDKIAADTDLLNKTGDVFNEDTDRLIMAADSDEDVAILENIKKLYAEGVKFASNQDEDLQAVGLEKILEAASARQQHLKNNEAQRIENETLMGAEKTAIFNTLRNDFRTDTANFEPQLRTADNVIEALNRGDGAAVTAALASMPLLVNPDAGATSDAEVQIWSGIGGTVDSLIGRLEKELTGGGLTDATRKEIIATANQYKRNAITWQQSVEARYGRFLATEDIPRERWGYFNKSSSVPELQGGGFIRRDKVKPAAEAAQDAIAEAVEAVQAAAQENPLSLQGVELEPSGIIGRGE